MKLKNIKEKRCTSIEGVNVRAITGTTQGERFIEGYASVFNQESKQLVEYHNGEIVQFTEVMLPGAFDEVLSNERLNVIHTIDHDRSKMLGRTISNTLKLTIDETGLKYQVSVPNTTLGNDLYEMISRGDYFESSFVFTVDDKNERWEKRGTELYRYISKVSGLYDTSTVVDGAYPNTVVVARDLKEFVEPEKVEIPVEEPRTEEQQNEIDLIDLEILKMSA